MGLRKLASFRLTKKKTRGYAQNQAQAQPEPEIDLQDDGEMTLDAAPDTAHFRREISKGTFISLGFLLLLGIYFSSVMGFGTMFSVVMSTAHDLLLNTIFYIMGVAVLAGAVSTLFSEFGVTALLNKLLAPLMKPLFNLPGVASLVAITTYFSDNTAVAVVAQDPSVAKYYKKYQWVTMINLGTTFGMGIILAGGILGIQSGKFVSCVAVGSLCTIVGGVVSNRLLMWKTKKMYGMDADVDEKCLASDLEPAPKGYRRIRDGGPFQRGLSAACDGGKVGVNLGMSIIPGVLIFTTLVMMLTNGPSVVHGHEVYQGVTYEGTGLLPMLGDKLSFILQPLFGLTNSQTLGLPLTSLGAAGASLAGAKQMADAGTIGMHDMTVYFAIAWCWSGFLSAHASIADTMKTREITTFAMFAQLIGGLVAGVVANYAAQLIF
ncbi:CD0519/CD1768 family membrane protein [Levilactobacillus suantsaii]|uniref:Transporter gate domain protein n=1 Tax=Levilactobacillus suantsaii TaxID=2292255 RepID=A0A4Q0VIR3_9LACO|nr:hypothetical protein [Levilactobacillus suantsaii]QMU08539.1 hypothetical protein H3M12_02355 [Levilactobacillus suantsaii]RXI78466.1 hypothetical protein DXH47_06790 [Levilactobacillus suantsaii]